jgi:DNA invertase Pin-like site-specific DNA recombinase
MRKRAAIYVRVSTDKQTIENQVTALRQIAEQRGWEVVEQYSDAGISGAKGRDGRPRLDQMFKDASRCKGKNTAALEQVRGGKRRALVTPLDVGK